MHARACVSMSAHINAEVYFNIFARIFFGLLLSVLGLLRVCLLSEFVSMGFLCFVWNCVFCVSVRGQGAVSPKLPRWFFIRFNNDKQGKEAKNQISLSFLCQINVWCGAPNWPTFPTFLTFSSSFLYFSSCFFFLLLTLAIFLLFLAFSDFF